MIDLERAVYQSSPYPMLRLDHALADADFNALLSEFPVEGRLQSFKLVMGGRRRLMSEEPAFYEFLQGSPKWAEFFNTVNSKEFVERALKRFKADIANYGGAVREPIIYDDSKYRRLAASKRDKAEDKRTLFRRISARLRTELSRLLARLATRDVFFLHFDISAAYNGYEREIHHDSPGRVIAFLIYFTDKNDTGGRGGEFGVHKMKKDVPLNRLKAHPEPAQTEVVSLIPPEKNLFLMFLSTPNSYHSVPKVIDAHSARKFIYVGITTSRVSFWNN